ncbi:cytochrome P450 [Mycobacterium kansasii]|uniref:Bifunctional cytochrome P450/NADPH--P450 reductase n=1 Tax=Mycobacterium attenuatum TaxID=2341086 RepID=A0A498PS68_9MYCO|nr:cytochrome P450 [Mycobacterium attenuatum]ORB86053.1 cytochrome P450 [Mycobacterium kansasii]VBA36546.1 Bifunctional cytochrome P450/NADPH--P450 reductase [Mycobacterium attenuatum]VBA49093.1 Bifunctional cytochrome P450/NADPH--P450 reductase [Mycobacterium attenuatum]VBA54588.1 Bifunctional cytochrome P450/NADPH--P450 reductase [Mycobacterium attenuatum]
MTPLTATPIPHPRFRLPVLGDVFTIDFASPVLGTTDKLRKSDGGILQQRIFGLSAIALADTALIEEVNNETRWRKHVGPLVDKLRLTLGDGLFTAYNDEPNWHKAHNILMPAFTKAAMKNYHDSITDTVRELIEAWNTYDAKQSWIEIPVQANRLTVEIIARAGLSHSFGNLSDPAENALSAAITRELGYVRRAMRVDPIPFYTKLFGKKRYLQHLADMEFIRGLVCEIVESRRRDPYAGQRQDMLDIMLHSADPDTGELLDADNIVAQMLTLMAAGSETSANAISFALYYLSTNPDVAAKAQAEIDQRWRDPDIPNIEFDDIAKLRYLRRVVDETLRLWPVAPGYYRQARCDTTLGNGKYSFRQGDWVAVVLLAAHRSSAWGSDADEFDPDRFLPENLRQLPPHIYKPFGTGPRACIGRQFALHEIVLTLATILHQYDLEAKSGYELKIAETLTLKPAGFQLRLHPRRRVGDRR